MAEGSVVGSLVVRLEADLRRFTGGFSDAAKTVQRFASLTTAPLRMVEGAIGRIFSLQRVILGTAIGATIKKVIDIGAAAEVTDQKFKLAFGGMAEGVRAWSEEMGVGLKRSADDIRGSAADLQLFLNNTQLSQKTSVNLTKSITELGYAMAGSGRVTGTAEEAIWGMQRAMMGMERPLMQMGVRLTDNEIKLWAHQHGLNANVKELTDSQRVVATAGVLWERYAGDIDKANQKQSTTRGIIQQLHDAIRELAEKVFEKWKPMIDKFFSGLRDWLIDNQATIAKWAGKVGAYVELIAGVVTDMVRALGTAPKETMQAFLEGLKEMLVAAAKIAVELGGPIVDSLWASMRAAIDKHVAGKESIIEERSKKIYSAMGGEWEEGPIDTSSYSRPWIPIEQGTWQTAQATARGWYEGGGYEREMTAKAVDWAAWKAKAGDIISATANTLGNTYKQSPAGSSLDKRLADFRARLDGITNGAKEAGDELAVTGQRAYAMGVEAGKAAEGAKKFADAMQETFHRTPDQETAVKAYFENLQREAELLALTTKGLYEKAEAQKAANEFQDKSITLTDGERAEIERFASNERVMTAWANAGKSISSSFEDAFVSIGKAGTKLRDLLTGLAEEIRVSFARAIYQSTIGKGIESMVGKVVGGFGKMFTSGLPTGGAGEVATAWADLPALSDAQAAFYGYHKGGLVGRGGPVYAASGLFRPRGTDTVPAMLTPGEAVLDPETTSRIQKILGRSGGGGGNRQEGLLQELVYQTKQQANKPAAVVVIDKRENTAEVMARHARRRGYLTRG